ncbi:MAG: NAD(P)H-hydrate dehydratase [Novosphingobium sp.]
MSQQPYRLDSDWLRDHPLPQVERGADKNSRGRTLVIGGSTTVPGGILLTAEAAFRAGAGKVQIATVERAAIPLGLAMPETAVIGLPEDEDGEIGSGCETRLAPWLARVDAVVAGPAMAGEGPAGRIVDFLLDTVEEATLVLDAAALGCLPPDRLKRLRGHRAPAILTPHIGEMAALLACEADPIERDRARAVRRAAECSGGVCLLKGSTSLVATPEGELFAYAGGGVGLATGGSGDVLAGLAGGLAARGAPPREALLWAVWLHGEAGRRCAEQTGPLGFMARELLAHVPGLMRAV